MKKQIVLFGFLAFVHHVIWAPVSLVKAAGDSFDGGTFKYSLMYRLAGAGHQ